MSENILPYYAFLPYVRKGLANEITQDETMGDNTEVDFERTKIKVKLKADGTGGQVPVSDTIERTIKLIGPGDVIGLNADAIIKTDPVANTADFEPNYLASIQFYDEDFAWRYSPAKAKNQQLRPWVFLLVLKEDEFTSLPAKDGALPVIEIADGPTASFLPKADETFAWAHVQLTDSIGHGDPINYPNDNNLTPLNDLDQAIQNFNDSIKNNPNLGFCRIISPRKLDPKTKYHAFLVPTYETGRLTGLGAEASVLDAIPAQQSAWGSAYPDPNPNAIYDNQWPVYYNWSFNTGEQGDFESLVKEIVPRTLDNKVGRRPMDINDPGYGLSYEVDLSGETKTTLSLEGALKAPGTDGEAYPYPDAEDDDNYDPVTDTNFRTQLQDLINLSEDLQSNGGLTSNYYGQTGNEIEGDLVQDDPIVAPPLYGRWHALQATADANNSSASGNDTAWIHELNLDPRNRVAASIGGTIIKEQQDHLIDEAWDQLGDVLEANEKLNWAQVAKTASSAAFAKSVDPIPDNKYIVMTGKMKRRIMNVGDTQTHYQDIKESVLPIAVEDRATRRIMRPIGPVMRRVDPTQQINSVDNLVNQFSASTLSAAPQKVAPVEAVTTSVSTLDTGMTSALSVSTTGYNFSISGIGDTPAAASNNAQAVEFNTALSAFGTYFDSTNWTPEPTPPTYDVSVSGSDIKTKTNPVNTIPERVYSNMTANGTSLPNPGSIQPVMAYPKFKKPMYESVRDLSTDYLIPNLHLVPSNTVSLLETNQKFIESFMVGLNHEMSRELLWREYPTDQRGTYFRQFWNVRDNVNTAGLSDADFEAANVDIKEIHEWIDGANDAKLGENGINVTGDNLVLLIRGDLLKKYPNTVIYAIKADWQRYGPVAQYQLPRVPLAGTEKFPIFNAKVDPDITFLGFDITETEAKGDIPAELAPHDGIPANEADAGYFFVLKERPGQSRFGMDVESANPPSDLSNWDELEWGVMNTTNNINLIDFSLLVGDEHVSNFGTPVKWNLQMNSAEMAMILYQKPVMISIHAQEMLGTT